MTSPLLACHVGCPEMEVSLEKRMWVSELGLGGISGLFHVTVTSLSFLLSTREMRPEDTIQNVITCSNRHKAYDWGVSLFQHHSPSLSLPYTLPPWFCLLETGSCTEAQTGLKFTMHFRLTFSS